MDQKFCQSCGMPMASDDLYGTNADGSSSKEYCKYCFQNGEFGQDETMEEMIESCVPHMVAANPNMTEEQAREMMRQFFPNLKRWQ